MYSAFLLDKLTLLAYNISMKTWGPKDIRDFRKRFNLTQKELAELIGVTRNYVYLLERGVRKPGKTLQLFFECLERDLKEKEKGR